MLRDGDDLYGESQRESPVRGADAAGKVSEPGVRRGIAGHPEPQPKPVFHAAELTIIIGLVKREIVNTISKLLKIIFIFDITEQLAKSKLPNLVIGSAVASFLCCLPESVE